MAEVEILCIDYLVCPMESHIGLDIGTHSTKLIELVRDKNIISIASAALAPTVSAGLTSNDKSDIQATAEAIKKIIKDSGTKSRVINISLPESQVFTRVIEVPRLSQRELSSAIKWEAEQYIPLPLDQVELDYTVIRDKSLTGANMMDVLLVAAPKNIISRYLAILEAADIIPTAVETEIISSARALSRSVTGMKTVMIASIGARTTDLAIIHEGLLTYTRSISVGGEAISKAVAQGLGFEFTQAEEYKKTYGLTQDQLQGKIQQLIQPIIDTVIVEIKRSLAFYEEHHGNETIRTIILNGGTAGLPGLAQHMAGSLKLDVTPANPWVGIQKDARFKALDTQGPVFAVAVGLALRNYGI